MKRPLVVFGMLSLLAVTPVFFSACAGGGTTQKAVAEAPISLVVTEVNQHSKLGTKVADGQYVVANIGFKNLTNNSLNLLASEFKLRNITDVPEEQYSQAAENVMKPAFTKEYGQETAEKILEGGVPLVSHPRIDMERYLIFMLPDKANLKKYELVYTPTDKKYAEVVVPLVSESTSVNDRRTVD